MPRTLRPIALGAIMVLVPAGFYVGTTLNKKDMTGTAAVAPPNLLPAGAAHIHAPEAPVVAPPPRMDPAEDVDMRIQVLEARLKGLKRTKFALETEIKDNTEKLARIEQRMARNEQ